MFSREESRLIWLALENYKQTFERQARKATHEELAAVLKKTAYQCEQLMEKMELTV